MYVESCTILVVVNRLSRPVVVLDRLPGLYGLKYDSATACGPPLYLCSYKLVGSATADTPPAQGKPRCITLILNDHWIYICDVHLCYRHFMETTYIDIPTYESY